MNNTVEFTIDGVGTFEFRSQLTHVEETKLEMIIDKFMDYKLNEIREDAFHYQSLAIDRILKNKFGGRKQSELNESEKAELDQLYKLDASNEAVIAKRIFWEIRLIEEPFKLNILKVRVPNGFDFLKIDKSKDSLFFKIMTEFNKAIEPVEQKKS